jgi:hypothetical protein
MATLRVPTYSQATGQNAPDRVQTPQALGAPRQQIDYSGLDLAARIAEKTGASVQDAGEHALARADYLQEKQDAADVVRAFSGFQDQERGMLGQEAQKLGLDARGADERGKSWYDEAIRTSAEQFQNPLQKNAFLTMALRARDTGLDALNKHVAGQNLALNRQGVDTAYANAAADVALFPLDEARRETAIANYRGAVGALLHGQDNGALLAEGEAKLRAEAIKRAAQLNPDAAMAMLESQRDKLGPAAIPLAQQMEQLAKARRIDTAYAKVVGEHGGAGGVNYARALSKLADPAYIASMGLHVDDAKHIADMLHGQYAQDLEMRDKSRAENDRKVLGEAYDLAIKGDKAGAVAYLARTPMADPSKRYEALNALKKEVWATDPSVQAELIRDIYSGRISDAKDMLPKMGNGISAETYKNLEETLTHVRQTGGTGAGINFFQQSIDKYDALAKQQNDPEMELRKQDFIATLDYYVRKEKLSGPQILSKADELMKAEPTMWQSLFGSDTSKNALGSRKNLVAAFQQQPWANANAPQGGGQQPAPPPARPVAPAQSPLSVPGADQPKTPASPSGLTVPGGDTPPKSALAAGKHTRFANGQVWTLDQQGKPTRVN